LKHYICISHSPWQTVPTRTQQLMLRLKGVHVLFFEPPGPGRRRPGRQLRPGLTLYTLPQEAEVEERHHFLFRRRYLRLARFVTGRMERHRFREPVLLPRTIPLHTMELLLSTIYRQASDASTTYQKKRALRDAAVIELLFATGIRISELCFLKEADVCLLDRTILIYGKGSKERKIQIGSDAVAHTLEAYKNAFIAEIQSCGYFFTSQNGTPLSDQSVRRMIRKYTSLAAIRLHITPRMFRHTFATSLLEADVDIRYIQKMLGHSSINVTEIYTHVAMSKQRDILTTKHPRKDFHIS